LRKEVEVFVEKDCKTNLWMRFNITSFISKEYKQLTRKEKKEKKIIYICNPEEAKHANLLREGRIKRLYL
jgi:hypothetical protein